ncbi:hypothetical protein CLOP_g8098 [Closterium sp. NIES-67]|nr:hypothetical protein CLOP_g8098 [Closterium sp. NIES-67]
MEVAFERHRSLSISDAPSTSDAIRASPLLGPASGPYNPAAAPGSFGAARARSRSASFSSYCPPPIVVPSNNLSDPAFPGSTSPSPSGYPDPAFPGSSCSPSPQDIGLSSCENSPAFLGHGEFFQARTVVRSPNQELVRQRAAESANMDSQWELPPSPGLRTPCTCRRKPCACAVLSKRASRGGPPLSSSNWGRRLRRSLSGGTSAASDGEGGAEPTRSRSLLLRRCKTNATSAGNSAATSDTEDMGYGSGAGGGDSGRSTTGRRAQFARLFTRSGTAPPRPSSSGGGGFLSGSFDATSTPSPTRAASGVNVSPPAANGGFVARCVSVDAAAAALSGGNGGAGSYTERSGRSSSATSQKYSRSPSPTSSGSRGAATTAEAGSRISGSRVTASGVTSPPLAALSPDSLPVGPSHPSRSAAPVPRVISIDNAVAWLNNTRKGNAHGHGRRSTDSAGEDGVSPASRQSARRASFGGGFSRAASASIGSATSANEDDLSRAWDDFTASAAAAAASAGTAGDYSASGGVSSARRPSAEQQPATARKRQPGGALQQGIQQSGALQSRSLQPQQQQQQQLWSVAKQKTFRPSASCGSLSDLVPDDPRGGDYSGGGYGGRGYGGDSQIASKFMGNLGSTHPVSRRGSSRPTPPPPRPTSPNAGPRAVHSRSPSPSGAGTFRAGGAGASTASATSAANQQAESSEPIRFRVNTNGRIYRSHTTPASLAPSTSSSSAAAAFASRTRYCAIPNSLSLQDTEPTALVNSPTIGRSIPAAGNDTSPVTSASHVSPTNGRRASRQVSFNELVRVRRIPRHFFSADLTATAMDLVSPGDDPTAGSAGSHGSASWHAINGIHGSAPAYASADEKRKNPPASTTALAPAGGGSPGGSPGGSSGAGGGGEREILRPRLRLLARLPLRLRLCLRLPLDPPQRQGARGGLAGAEAGRRAAAWRRLRGTRLRETRGMRGMRGTALRGARGTAAMTAEWQLRGLHRTAGLAREVAATATAGVIALLTVAGSAVTGVLPPLLLLLVGWAEAVAWAATVVAWAAAMLLPLEGQVAGVEVRVQVRVQGRVLLGRLGLFAMPGARVSWNVPATTLHAWRP